MSEIEVKAIGRYIRISPYKVRILIGGIKGKKAGLSVGILKVMHQKGAKILGKILNSAIANAEQNNKLDVDSLIVKNVIVDQGPTLKRFKARARGKGTRILKRSSHITVIVAKS